jgi:hypothetical protein
MYPEQLSPNYGTQSPLTTHLVVHVRPLTDPISRTFREKGNYKKLFGPPEDNSFEMMENRIDDIPQLSEEENVHLTTNFSEEEAFEAISEMEHNKAA